MQSVDLTELSKFEEKLKNILGGAPERRRELHERIADAIKEEVDYEIAASGLNDSSGRVRQWQTPYVGSRGGYAAVRATNKGTGNNSPGAITNYLENGHKIRRPSGVTKYYRPRIRVPYVDGYHFYQSARNRAESRALEIAEAYADEIADMLEG